MTLRRRVDASVLRWQARLDSAWADRVVPWATAAGLFVVLALLALAHARSLESPVDLAGYSQAAWLIQQGLDPVMTATTDLPVLSQQAAFLFVPLAWAISPLPIAPALLVIQSAALAIGAVPVWKIARRHANLRTGGAGALLFAYCFYPAVHNLNLDGFHPETIALPALLFGIYWGMADRWRLFMAMCVLVVLTRADLGLAVAGLGGVLVLNKHPRRGALTIVAGTAWTVLAIAVIQPHYASGDFPHLDAFAAFGDTPLSALWGMIVHPGQVLGQLISEQNFQLLVFLLAPVLFLPLLAPRYLVPILPLQFLYMLADVPSSAVFGQQTVAITAFVFLATAFALAKIGRLGVEKIIVDRRVLYALVLASTVFFIHDAAASPYRAPWNWGGRDVVDQARVNAAESFPDDAAVRASPSLLSLLAQREEVFPLDAGDRPDGAAAADGVDVVVLDQSQVPDWTIVEQQVFRLQLDSLGFDKVSEAEGIEVFVRRDSAAAAEGGP
ncbi:MAG: DUF2079 domain-containing protein [Acidimicrobiales bacterium]|nr:DUF2079 domain-containing protein [Acidimicrobiales bacterium]MCB1250268.1 DUF2079 domain-containing protein [Acidimicrobiales bacterium]MCB1258854.1 DUF2079 domain-containing protein [Acidimicrobiales bacterium]